MADPADPAMPGKTPPPAAQKPSANRPCFSACTSGMYPTGTSARAASRTSSNSRAMSTAQAGLEGGQDDRACIQGFRATADSVANAGILNTASPALASATIGRTAFPVRNRAVRRPK